MSAMSKLHSLLDRSSRPTWQYERAVRVLLETLLLIACAAPVVTGRHSLIAQVIVGALRLHQAEVGREKASIIGRAKEHGFILDPLMGLTKKKRLAILDARDAIITWFWPVLVPIVSASETNAFTWALGIGIIATMIRVWFDKWAMPKWRAGRVEWRKANFKQRHAVTFDRMSPEWRAAFERARDTRSGT
jgi:hypothetical protein